jgi:anthranilate 1,2-dioxygenase large subunit
MGMGLDSPEQTNSNITENLIRRFWAGYQRAMGY